jgi:hypothetical protein
MIKNSILVLISLNPDRTDCAGNEYPESGYIRAAVYYANSNILHGLYGIAWGKYRSNKWLNVDEKAEWCIVRIDRTNEVYCIDEDESLIKFQTGSVVYSGNRFDCEKYIDDRLDGSERDVCFQRPTILPAIKEQEV